MSRVLIVDDSETIVNFLRMVLESEQYEVDTASDGTEGLAKAHQSLPDLIITDSIMPGMDGFSLLHALRADPATEAVPVIMLTSGDPHDPDHIVRRPATRRVREEVGRLEPLLAESTRGSQPPALISHSSRAVLFQHTEAYDAR